MNIYTVGSDDVKDIIKERAADANKGDFGYVGILGGCIEYSGAVKLADLSCAAMRAGCGVCRLIIPSAIAPAVGKDTLESTLFPVPDKDGHMLYDEDVIAKAMKGLSAVSVGMGWGQSEDNAPILRFILKEYKMPVIIDADGLNTLAAMKDAHKLLVNSKCRIILTPHLKEFSRLTGYSIQEIKDNPIEYATGYAKENHVIVLLKGSRTTVTDGSDTYLSDSGCPGMATAGSGDVLSGILTGMMGYVECSPRSVACGAYIAGKAGEMAQKERGAVSMIASDTVNRISDAIMLLHHR